MEKEWGIIPPKRSNIINLPWIKVMVMVSSSAVVGNDVASAMEL
jgi:hypothetical protein